MVTFENVQQKCVEFLSYNQWYVIFDSNVEVVVYGITIVQHGSGHDVTLFDVQVFSKLENHVTEVLL